jgi:type 1 glutamine amidotransferase
VIAGDDVYEDLFTASCELQDLLVARGLVARVRIGIAALEEASCDDLIVLYTAGAVIDGVPLRALRAAVESGAGLVSVHSSVLPQNDSFDRLAGVVFRSHGPLPHSGDVRLRVDHAHPLAPAVADVDGAVVGHEHYRTATLPGVRALVWRDAPYGPEPLMTTNRVGRGRVCWVQFGHDMAAWGDPAVRKLIDAAASWAADLPQARENED